mgnify:FL=1
MQDVSSLLSEMNDVYKRTLGYSPPDISPDAYLPFPPGADPIAFAMDEVNHLQQMAHRTPQWPHAVPWIPPTNTYTKDDAFIVEMDLPGMAKEDLEVLVQGADCVVRGERKPEKKVVEARPLVTERSWGVFERRFTLPPNANPDAISAKYADGVLTLELPFVEEGKAHEKEVKIT